LPDNEVASLIPAKAVMDSDPVSVSALIGSFFMPAILAGISWHVKKIMLAFYAGMVYRDWHWG
jgi:hypothetical protein